MKYLIEVAAEPQRLHANAHFKMLEACRDHIALYISILGIGSNSGFLQIKEVLDGSRLQP